MRSLATAVAMVFVMGCAGTSTSVDTGTTGRTSDGALMKLHTDPNRPVWADWSPVGEPQTSPDGFGETARAFDYWQVDDTRVIDEVWGAIFPVLDHMRGDIDSSRQRQALDLLLGAIEPSKRQQETRMDLTFLVNAADDTPFEGFACRLYRPLDGGATPSVTIVLLRDPQKAKTPGRIIVWAAPGFQEPEAVTAVFERRTSGWRRGLSGGLSFPDAAQGEDEGLQDAETVPLVARLLTDSVWKRFAGTSYLESPQSGAESSVPHPDGIARALGLSVDDRTIDRVYSNTEFPPRADLDAWRKATDDG